MFLRDVCFIVRLAFGELFRFLENWIVGRSIRSTVATEKHLYGSVLCDAFPENHMVLVQALDLATTRMPVVGAWLDSEIDIIKTSTKSMFTGAFHYSGVMIAISFAETQFAPSLLARLLVRRIALARMVRSFTLLSPCALMRAHVLALLFERRFARKLTASAVELDRLTDRILAWEDIFFRWSFGKRSEVVAVRLHERVYSEWEAGGGSPYVSPESPTAVVATPAQRPGA